MNHPYPDNYHGGYSRGAAGMQQNMGYGHGGYENPSSMVRMGHPRNSYNQMPQQYGEGGQVHPMMQQQHQPGGGGGMYPSHGGYMGQMTGSHYGMGTGNYPGYNMVSGGMNHPVSGGMPVGPRGHHNHNMMGGYYNSHPSHPHQQQHPHHHQHPSNQQQQHTATTPIANQQAPSPGYGHQSPSGNTNPNTPTMPTTPHGQPQNQNTSQQAAVHHHPTPSNMQRSNHGSAPQTSTPSHTAMPTATTQNNNGSFQGQGQQVPSPLPSNVNMMMPSSHTHTQPRPPVAGSMSGGGATHPIPQHPMRHPTTQQSPQEVADNILQIASSYPTNQTVQVPLKGRHAPYHIPRSPHYNASSSSSTSSSSSSLDTTAVATNTNHFQQHTSPASQPSPTPSTSSVKSPTPAALAPIPNPIPSPGISGVRSPPSSHCLSPPCGSQRSPGHMTSSYSGHSSQPSPSQHYSPISGGGTPQHLSAAFAHSPTSRNSSFYPSPNDQISLSHPDNQSLYGSYSNTVNTHQSSSPGNMTSPSHTNMPSSNFNQQQCGVSSNNPLMSLQKLVMLPETQVIDPKSVVNDACLAAAAANTLQSENNADSKNSEGPAERFVESSSLSVGCSGQSSSLSGSQSDDSLQRDYESSQTVLSSLTTDDIITSVPISDQDEIKGTGYDVNETNSLTTTAVSTQDGDIKNVVQEKEANISQCTLTDIPYEEEGKSSPDRGGRLNIFLDPDSKPIKSEDNEKLTDNFERNHVDIFQQASSDATSPLHEDNSNNISEGEKGILLIKDENVKQEKLEDSLSDSLDSKSLQKNSEKLDTIVSVIDEIDNDPNKESENSHMKKEGSPVKQNDSENLLKQLSPECKSSGVLSEVQVVVNGNGIVSTTEEEEGDEECEEITRPRLRNGLKSVVRSKLEKPKKFPQFIRLTTPCSIAVGADEREVCEQFAFRRNGYCHALRASRLMYSGRGRQDSTSHGDSDESVENISDNSFQTLGNPQDGCKKKNVAAKRNDANGKQSNSGQKKVDGKEKIVGKGSSRSSSNSGSFSNNQESHIHDKDLSDEDAELCYYEGVDSSDFVINNNSSDDSFSSSPDSKQKRQESTSTVEDGQDNSAVNLLAQLDVEKKVIELGQGNTCNAASSPPAKRTRRSPGQKQNEVISNKKSSMNDSKISHTIINGTSGINNIHSKRTINTKGSRLSSKSDENSSDRENGKIQTNRMNRRKAVLGKALTTNEQSKLPEVLVKLEKSNYLESATNLSKIDFVDLTDSPPKEEKDVANSTNVERHVEASYSKTSFEKVKVAQDIKVEAQDSIAQDNAHASPSKSKTLPSKRKRPAKRKQKTEKTVVKGRNEEVRDSFKSMKFSRTLDMMKSQRKKEQNLIGPFVRIIGDRMMPAKVSVINQSTQNQMSCTSKQNQKSSTKQPVSSSSAIHMVSNLPSDKSALVSSTKTVSHQTWACAFCNRQSSFHSLGDLFGPYYREDDLPKVENLALEEAKKAKDNISSEKKGALTSPSSKKRKSSVKKEVVLQEVWIHEACALWAPGVYVIGSKLYGMEDAMKDAADSMCSACKQKGAMVGCLHKGCAMKYHINCAIDKDCSVDEENLSLLCPKHKDKRFRISYATTSGLPLS